ncbi:MAG: aminotransferase class V-fold PLP-dependent enzyme [Balneolaceae bacterium]
MLTRRKALQLLSTLPVGGLMVGQLAANDRKTPVQDSLATTLKNREAQDGENIFRSLGVEPVINCRGTFTIIGGSIEHDHVKQSMRRASNNFVQYDELAFGIAERLAELTGAEYGMISAGCAAALKHVTAGCVTGGNPEKLVRIPDLTGFEKTQVIMPRRSRNAYDHAIRNIGVEIINVETVEELEKAIGPKTALVCVMSFQDDELSAANISSITKRHGVPLLVDAAAENMTIPNVHLEAGADVVAYSGGKAMNGPQCAGVILGRKDIVKAAWQASSPHHGPGRDNKVGREEMIGGMAAVEAWIMRDHDAEWQRWLGWLNNIGEHLSTINGITYEISEPEGLGNKTPRLNVMWNPNQFHITGDEVAEIVGRSKPRIALGGRGGDDNMTSISITSGQMQPGEDEIVKNRLYEVLSERRQPKQPMRRPGGDLTGRWNVDISYFLSNSNHTITLEKQDGNWVYGSHKGDFTTRDIAGTIEGNEIKLVSVERKPGNSVPNYFIGELNGNQFSGRLFMGEYLNASYVASKHMHDDGDREPIMVPDGPPLAT